MLDTFTKKAWTPNYLKVVFSVQHWGYSIPLGFDRCGVVGWTNHSFRSIGGDCRLHPICGKFPCNQPTQQRALRNPSLL